MGADPDESHWSPPDPFTSLIRAVPREFVRDLAQFLGYHEASRLLAVNRTVSGLVYDCVDTLYSQLAAQRELQRLRIAHVKIGFVDGLESPGLAETGSVLQEHFQSSMSESLESDLKLAGLRGRLSAYALLVPAAHPLHGSIARLNRDLNNQSWGTYPWTVCTDGSGFPASSQSSDETEYALSGLTSQLSDIDAALCG